MFLDNTITPKSLTTSSLRHSAAALSLATSQPTNTLGSASIATTSRSSVASSLRHSAEIREGKDKDHHISISPSNMLQLIESSDENDNDSEVVQKDLEVLSAEETDEAEHGTTHESVSYHTLALM